MIVQKGLEVSKNPKRKLISLPFSSIKRTTRDHLLQIIMAMYQRKNSKARFFLDVFNFFRYNPLAS